MKLNKNFSDPKNAPPRPALIYLAISFLILRKSTPYNYRLNVNYKFIIFLLEHFWFA